MPKKITYIISNVDKALEFEWVIQYLNKNRFDLSFIILNSSTHSALADFALKHELKVKMIRYGGQMDFVFALMKTWLTLLRWRPGLINCHLPEGTLIGLLAGKLAFIRNRIYTRHHSTLNHHFHPHAVKYDRWSNHLANGIIAVSETVKDVLIQMEGVKPSKVEVVEHCLDIEPFDRVNDSRKKEVMISHEIPSDKLIIGVIARYTKWKGVQYIIPAFKQLLENYPNAHLVIANAKKGDYLKEIEELLSTLPSDSYTEILFESDLYALYRVFDLFVHVPIDYQSEAFGQIYLEALASRTPSIFTRSGIGNQILKDQYNCLVVDYQNSDAIYKSLLKLLQNKNLCEELKKNGYKLVKEQFSIGRKINLLEKIYE